jgi:hypothetical protein
MHIDRVTAGVRTAVVISGGKISIPVIRSKITAILEKEMA